MNLWGKPMKRKSMIQQSISNEIKNVHPIKLEKFDEEIDTYFIHEILTPYLSSVYVGLIERQTKRDYLCCRKTKHYLNMPELIGERIVKQINSNGDERIDHDEFIDFMLKVTVGTV